MWPDIRKVLSTEDIDHNFEVVMENLELLAGSNPAQVGPYVPATGGTFTGSIDAPAISVNGEPVARESLVYSIADADATFRKIADSYTKTEIDAMVPGLATTTVAGSVLEAAAITTLGITISATPTQAEVQSIANKVDEIISKLKTSGAIA